MARHLKGLSTATYETGAEGGKEVNAQRGHWDCRQPWLGVCAIFLSLPGSQGTASWAFLAGR